MKHKSVLTDKQFFCIIRISELVFPFNVRDTIYFFNVVIKYERRNKYHNHLIFYLGSVANKLWFTGRIPTRPSLCDEKL